MTVVVLAAPSCAGAVAASLALALARSVGAPCGIAAVLGTYEAATGAGVAMPRALRIAACLRARGQDATASGRLVWLADRRAAGAAELAAQDPVGAAAAIGADLGRAAIGSGVPGVLALPLSRTAGLDRALTWHDGIVAVHELSASDVVVARVIESVAALGLPVACMPPPTRPAAALAQAGLRAPSVAVRAVAELGLGLSANGRAG